MFDMIYKSGKMRAKIFLLAVMFAAFCFAGNARADYWTRYNSTNSGLPSNSWVYKMAEDSRGTKWLFGSANSNSFLFAYDGSSWHDYSSDFYGAVGTYWTIVDIYADNSGNVWFIGSNWDLVSFDGNNWTNLEDNAEEIMDQIYEGHIVTNPSLQFYSVFGDPDGNNLYALTYMYGTLDGNTMPTHYKVLKRSASGNWSVAIDEDYMMTPENMSSLAGKISSTGDIWFRMSNSSGAGIYRYRNGSWTRYTTSDGLVSNNVADHYIDSSGNVWLATERGVSKFNGSSWESWTTDNSELATNIVTGVEGDSEGKIWFVSTWDSDTGALGGTSIYDSADGSWSYYSIRNGIDDFQYAYYIFILGDEMWATTGSTGVLALENNNSYSTIYGQVNGTTVDKAAYGELKKSRNKSRKVDIWKITRVQNRKGKWKTRRQKVYHTKTSDWYKKLNLETGTYLVKVGGKKSRTVTISSGDPHRLNF
jgi:ligand-binding sensor domain-containing protein